MAEEKRPAPVTVRDFERLARERMGELEWRFISTGADEERTLHRNEDAFRRVLVRPQNLMQRSVAAVETETELVGGTRVAFPIGVSPSAFHSFADPRGEISSVEGAASMGALFTISPWAHKTMGELRAAAGPTAPQWADVYIFEDREKTTEMVREAERVGCRAIVVSVDIPVLSKRVRYHNYTLQMLQHMKEKMIWPSMIPQEGEERYWAADPNSTWSDFHDVVKSTRLAVVAKGVTTAAAARSAVAAGAAAVWVSTHGGRQLDSQPASIEVLEEVIAAVPRNVDVYVDSGFRSGIDVYKALALGAKAAFVGRPVMWGLAVGGAGGVADVLGLLRDELRSAMALTGAATLHHITRDSVLTHFHKL